MEARNPELYLKSGMWKWHQLHYQEENVRRKKQPWTKEQEQSDPSNKRELQVAILNLSQANPFTVFPPEHWGDGLLAQLRDHGVVGSNSGDHGSSMDSPVGRRHAG